MSEQRVIPGSPGVLHLVDTTFRSIHDRSLCRRKTGESMSLSAARFFWPADRICGFCERIADPSPGGEKE